MINKRGSGSDILWQNVAYIVFTVIFFAGILLFLNQQSNGAFVWEDFYAKEISRVINLAEAGDELQIDVQKATGIALRNDVSDIRRVFEFDNAKNEICVKLSARKTCYNYYNNVDVVDAEVILASGDKGDVNILSFKVVEKRRDENAK